MVDVLACRYYYAYGKSQLLFQLKTSIFCCRLMKQQADIQNILILKACRSQNFPDSRNNLFILIIKSIIRLRNFDLSNKNARR